jgi:putative MATE family efflux protein
MKNKLLKDILIISIPIILQNLIGTSLNLIDTFMVGKLGQDALSAVGLANQVYFLLVLIIFGINSGASVFMSQFWGKGDEHSIKRTLGVALITGIIVSTIFTIPALLFPKGIISIFISDINVVNLGSQYLFIVAFSYIINSISVSYSVASRSIAQAKLPMLVSLIALIINVFLNYVLIYGNLGFPNLGVNGAAIATLIARIMELIILLIVLKNSSGPLNARIKELIDYNFEFYRRIMKTALPVIINEGLWALGTIMYTKAIAHLGSLEFASYQLAYSIFRFFEILFIGIAGSAQVLVGTSIGADDYEKTKSNSKYFFKLNLIASIILAVLMFFSSTYLLKLYGLEHEMLETTIHLVQLLSIFSIFKNINLLLIVGILRGGGDTTFAAKLEIANVWLIGVPLGFIGAYFISDSVLVVATMIMTEEVVKAFFGYRRFLKGKWIKNLVNEVNKGISN